MILSWGQSSNSLNKKGMGAILANAQGNLLDSAELYPDNVISVVPKRLGRERNSRTEMDINTLRAKQLRKHVAAIHTSGELSLLERKMANVLLLNAYDNLLTERLHKINVKILCGMLGWTTSNNLEDLRGALRGLVSKSIEFNLLDDGKEDWQITSLLSFGRIKDGVCSYRYDEALAERLYDPEMYATINLQMQKQFEGGYALTLYENIARYKNVGQTGWWELEKFRNIIGAQQEYYSEFRRLKEKVIVPSVKEINRVSDIEADFELKKKGVKVVAIKFFVKEGAQQTLLNPLNRADFSEIKEKPAFKKLIEHGISELLALSWVTADEQRALDAVSKAEQLDRQGRIKSNTAGYIRTLIESGTPLGASKYTAQKEKEISAKRLSTEERKREEQMQALREDFARESWKKTRAALTNEDLETYAEMFLGSEDGKKTSSFDPETLKFKNAAENLKFNNWLRITLKKPFDENEFLVWAEKKAK